MMRANMDEALQDFLLCYNQAEQFCRSYPSVYVIGWNDE